jgi:hypothetical protein
MKWMNSCRIIATSYYYNSGNEVQVHWVYCSPMLHYMQLPVIMPKGPDLQEVPEVVVVQLTHWLPLVQLMLLVHLMQHGLQLHWLRLLLVQLHLLLLVELQRRWLIRTMVNRLIEYLLLNFVNEVTIPLNCVCNFLGIDL